MTLMQVFDKMNIKSADLNVDALDVQVFQLPKIIIYLQRLIRAHSSDLIVLIRNIIH